VLEDAEHLIGDWNEPQAQRMLLLFGPTIAQRWWPRYWFL
jgi:hypothetical protein